MREITQKIYNFNELSEEIQKKLIEKEKENQKELFCMDFLYSEMKYKASELLVKYFKNKAVLNDVHYSLGYSQGDGAMIDFNLKYYGKYISVKHDYLCRYYHERSFIIETLNGQCLSEKQKATLIEKIVEMNIELKNFGYKAIENSASDDDAEDILNEYEFFENGEVY